MDDNRANYFVVIFGGQNCGKTTLLLEIIRDYAKYQPWKRQLIGVPDFAEEKLDNIVALKTDDLITKRFNGIKKILIRKIEKQKDPNNFFVKLKKFFLPDDENPNKPKPPKFNGQLIIDDARGVFNRRDESFLDFASRRRQANCDIITVFHGMHCEVPPSFFTWVTKLIIYETADAAEDIIMLIPKLKRAEFIEVYERVQGVASGAIPPPDWWTDEHPDPEHVKHYHEELVLRKI